MDQPSNILEIREPVAIQHAPYAGISLEKIYTIFIKKANDLHEKFGAHVPDDKLQDLRLEVQKLSRTAFYSLQMRVGTQALASIEKKEPHAVSERIIENSDMLFGFAYANRLAASSVLYAVLYHNHHFRLSDHRASKSLFSITVMFELTSALRELIPESIRNKKIQMALKTLEEFLSHKGDESMKQAINERQRHHALWKEIEKNIPPLHALMCQQEAQVRAWTENHPAESLSHAQEMRTRLYHRVMRLASVLDVEEALPLIQEVIHCDKFAASLTRDDREHNASTKREEANFPAASNERAKLMAIAMEHIAREYEAHAQDIHTLITERTPRKERLKNEEDARSFQEDATIFYELAEALCKGDLAVLVTREIEQISQCAADSSSSEDSTLKERRDMLIAIHELAKRNISDAIALAYKYRVIRNKTHAYALTLLASRQ